MLEINLEKIEHAVKGKINNIGFYDICINGVSIDTRDKLENKLFIPFKGENFDAHNFINDAFVKGAKCCFSENESIINNDFPIIYVKSVRQAIMDFAQYYRSIFQNINIIAITGSTGKTTTKDMIASIFSQKYNTLKTIGNFNNEIGLPLTIFGIEKETEVAIVEMGMNNFGEIHNLSKIAKPNIGIITNIGFSHIENLGSREGILKAKSEIFDFMDKNAKAILNANDEMLISLKNKRENLIFYGTESDNDFYATDIEYKGIKGIKFVLNKKTTSEKISININIPGFHMILNALCAATVANLCNISLEDIKKGIETFKLSNMRMDIFETDKKIRIINDVYNASPTSMEVAINVLEYAENRKIAVLGDMFELGELSSELHYNLGEYISTKNIDYVLTCGDDAHYICKAIKKNTKNSTITALHFDEKTDLTKELKSLLEEKDTVLIKASRGMKFEEIIKTIC